MMIFLPHRDEKSQYWRCFIEDKYNAPVYELKAHPFFQFIEVFLVSINKRHRPVYVFRYLSDYPDLLRTLLRLLADILIIFVCLACFGELRWVAHNVDKETHTKFYSILSIRRRLIGLVAKKIYVTDEFLLAKAKVYLPAEQDKFRVIPFGTTKPVTNLEFSRKVSDAIARFRQAVPSARVFGLCATSPSNKCEHILNMADVLDQLNCSRVYVVMVLVCDFRRAKDDRLRSVLQNLRKRNDVLCFSEGGEVSEEFLKKQVNFIYRSLSDVSVPYTVYKAANAKIPLLTHDDGITAKLVKEYGIGIVWEELGRKGAAELERACSEITPDSFEKFFATRTWEKGADALMEGVLEIK